MSEDERPAADLVTDLASAIRGALGDDLVGLYLYGSSVSGGFSAGVSDVDLLAVTAKEVGALDTDGLAKMQDAFVVRYPEWRDRLEIVYVGRATLRSFRTSSGSLAVISPGEQFHIRDEPAAAWLQNWYLARETAICLHGPDATAIVPPIEWTEFVGAVGRYAAELRNRSRPGAGGEVLAYTILTMCRALCTARTARHHSKQEAAAWTSQQMPEWAWLIDAALACRLSRGASGFKDEASCAAAETLMALLEEEILRTPPGRGDAPGSSATAAEV
jgi:hypothetical protein